MIHMRTRVSSAPVTHGASDTVVLLPEHIELCLLGPYVSRWVGIVASAFRVLCILSCLPFSAGLAGSVRSGYMPELDPPHRQGGESCYSVRCEGYTVVTAYPAGEPVLVEEPSKMGLRPCKRDRVMRHLSREGTVSSCRTQ